MGKFRGLPTLLASIVFLMIFTLVYIAGCAFFGPSGPSTPTQDEQARAVVGGIQGFLPNILVAGNTFIAVQPQYAAAWPGAIAILNSTNQTLAVLEAKGAAGQTITANDVLIQMQAQILPIINLFSQWASAPGGGSPSPAQTGLLVVVGLAQASNLISQFVDMFSGNYPTWATIQAENTAFQAQLSGGVVGPVAPPLQAKVKKLLQKKGK
jgi:hypothetical protein